MKEEYPQCTFDNNSRLQKVTNTDVVRIASLLMHYSCVLSRKDSLTSPLCKALPQTTQIQIKLFLEGMHTKITKEEFTKLTDDCLVKESVPSTPRNLIGEDFSSGCRSPLQEFLRTPQIKISHLQEKEKEINMLRSALDWERFEKSDLQDELNTQQERNKNLSKLFLI